MFDPYHKWLGIPPKDQPPNHYRLLTIELFESDLDVIDAAANKQMAYVQGCATGPHTAASQRILNEIAAARLCLLDTNKKAAYDANLRSRMAVRTGIAAASHSDAVTPEPPAQLFQELTREIPGAEEEDNPRYPFRRTRTPRQPFRRRWQWSLAIAGVLLGVGALLILTLFPAGRSNPPRIRGRQTRIPGAPGAVSPPKKEPFDGGKYKGIWSIRYSNGSKRTYHIDEAGEVVFQEERRRAKLRKRAIDTVLDFADNKLERLELVGDELRIEHFNPATSYPGRPDCLGVGVKRSRAN